ncbi:Conserved oligomeric Golgi complex subunit 4 [Sergentomyia squamirostris]
MNEIESLDYEIKNSNLSSTQEIEDFCRRITLKEDDVKKRLDEILSRQSSIHNKLVVTMRNMSKIASVKEDSQKLHELIKHTGVLAENVSAKVRRFDEARGRVSECQQRVHDLIDLQLCSQGVMTAIKEEDYEKGAAHIHRFLSMDESLLKKTADDVSESVSSVNKAVDTLQQATTQLRHLITQKFDEAVKKDDLASVERFFKIFPLLGMHDHGIEKFSKYICLKLNAKAQKELRTSMDTAKAEKRTVVAFADTLTILLENIARVVEVNQPIIDTYYGTGRLHQMVKHLQEECDQEVKICLLEFNKGRQIQRRISQINEYIKGGAGVGSSSVGHYRKPSGGSVDKLNPKDIDSLIGEITIMHSRAELYLKFMKRRIARDLEESSLDEERQKQIKAQVENCLKNSDLNRQMQELLGIYLLFERFFMEESVLKAIALDSHEPGQQCSSMIDDVFFILRKCIRRANTTQSLDGICAVINNAASSLENDFIVALKAPLKAGYPSGYIDLAQAYNVLQSSIQHGKIQTSDAEQSRNNFLVKLNDADIATEYIETLWTMMTEEIKIACPALSEREKEKLESCTSGLKSVGDTLKAVIDFGMQQLRSSAIKPRLHQWVDEFLNISHNLTEEELVAYNAGETFVQSLISQIDGLLKSFENALSQRNYGILVEILATDITARLERVIRKSTFNRLGGLVLDQEVRTLSTYLTGATSWSVRDKLARLTQIATILNLDRVNELSDYYNPSDTSTIPTWRLSPNEIKPIMTLRVDFRMDDIKKLKI